MIKREMKSEKTQELASWNRREKKGRRVSEREEGVR